MRRAARWAGMGVLGLLLVGFGALAQAEGGTQTRRSQVDGVEQLAAKLSSRERAIERREASLVDREGDLRAAEERLTARLDELNKLRADIDVQLEGLAEDDERRRAALVTMLEKMKPKEAAPLVAALDVELAVDVIDRMATSKAGKLLAQLPPPIAADLAERLTTPVEIP